MAIEPSNDHLGLAPVSTLGIAWYRTAWRGPFLRVTCDKCLPHEKLPADEVAAARKGKKIKVLVKAFS